MLRVAAILTLVSLPVLAEPPKAFSEKLNQGRELEAKGKHAEAAAAFEAALRITPDDPAALAELGWVQYELKDLKKAEASTRAALAKLPKDDLPDAEMPWLTLNKIFRGGALYNLGRILEDGGDKAGAIKAYRDAHVAYPRAVVRSQLAKLDAAAAAELEPYRPVTMKGPFVSIDAYCKSVETKPRGDDCKCGQALKNEGSGKLAKPFEQVAVFSWHGCDQDADQDLDLAVKLAAGWYVATALPTEFNNSTSHCDAAQWHFKGATIAKTTLRLDYTTTAECHTKGSDWGWDEHATIAIGVGPSGTPSATPPITSKWDMLPEHSHRIAARLTWAVDAVDVAGTFAEKPTALNLAGKHKLVFP